MEVGYGCQSLLHYRGCRLYTTSMRVLVVEPDPVSAKLIDAALKSEGIIAEPAERGEDAIDLAKHYDFDALILETQSPI